MSTATVVSTTKGPIDTQILLDTLEAQVEQHLAEAVRTYQNMPMDDMLRRPSHGGWSAGECLWHLNSYGAHYLPEIRKGLEVSTASASTFTSTWMGAWFTRMMQPGKGKMKTLKGHNPPPALDAPAVVAEFIHQQELLLSLLRRARLADLNRIRIGLSIMPFLKMRLGDVFQFLIVHQERHLQQARRVWN